MRVHHFIFSPFILWSEMMQGNLLSCRLPKRAYLRSCERASTGRGAITGQTTQTVVPATGGEMEKDCSFDVFGPLPLFSLTWKLRSHTDRLTTLDLSTFSKNTLTNPESVTYSSSSSSSQRGEKERRSHSKW